VVENADNCVHITMPMAPDGHHELSDEELSAAAGGGNCLPTVAGLLWSTCVANSWNCN
jgi:hypothetical protein